VAASAAFYERVFGWAVDAERSRFSAPGIIGEWTTDRPPAGEAGPVVWILGNQLFPLLLGIETHGGRIAGRPVVDGGERYLVECDDPSGNRIGVAVPIRRVTQAQTLIAVRDVEASSRWYQKLLGLGSGHGGPVYERLLSGDTIVLQLHSFESDHHHGPIGDPTVELGNGALVWFGETADFDEVVARADELGATIVRPPLRNAPEGEGNGPAHRELWLKDLDGYTVVVASPDGEVFEPSPIDKVQTKSEQDQAGLVGRILRGRSRWRRQTR
jgi:predicted enzyme related to lactoylglutathione lyase